MKKTAILIVMLLLMSACTVKPAEPVDEYSDEKLKEHGLEIVQSNIKLDFSKRIINAAEVNYSDKEGDSTGYALIDEGFGSWLAVFDRMFEEGNYTAQILEFEPIGIIASALVDEDFLEYRPYEMLQNEIITLYISYDDFDILNNLTSYDLGFSDEEYRSKLFLTLKKDNTVYLQKAEADEMMGDFQSIRLVEEYPVFESQEKISGLFASRDDFDGKISENASAIIITDKSVYLGTLKDDEFSFRALDYLSGLREKIYFIAIGREAVTIVLSDGRVLSTTVGKLN